MVQYINPSTLDGADSKYDFNLHMPVPTLDYIRREIGEDIVINTGGEEKAKAYVRQYTKTAYNILMSRKITTTKNQMQYLIAVNKEWRNAFLSYVASLLNDIFTGGYIDKLTDVGIDKLSFQTVSMLEGSLLGIDRINYFYYDYLKGY